jgi:hypothetical protein
MGGDPKLEALVKSNARWCVISVLLAIVVPLGLHVLFERQARRLEALADHGRQVQATVLAIEQQDGKSYTEYGYVVDDRAASALTGAASALSGIDWPLFGMVSCLKGAVAGEYAAGEAICTPWAVLTRAAPWAAAGRGRTSGGW